MAASRSLLPPQQTQEFIKEMALRMEALEGDKIDIQMGKNSVYEGKVGSEPDMSKLTETRAGVLRAAVNMDAPSIGEKGDPSTIKQAIAIYKNDEQVFRFEKGQVIESRLTEPEPAQRADVQAEAQIEGVEVVSQEPSSIEVFESTTPINVVRKEVEASELPQDSNVRASTQDFVQQKEAALKLQQEEKGVSRLPRSQKKTEQKNGNGTKLGFEQTLWAAADKQRGHMDAAEYKHVVLGLIFLKYISDHF